MAEYTVYYNNDGPAAHKYRLTFSSPDNQTHSHFTFQNTAELFAFVLRWDNDPPIFHTHITEIEAIS